MGFVRRITGKTGAQAAKDAAGVQAGFAREAGQLFNPLGFGGANSSRISELDKLIADMQAEQGSTSGGGMMQGIRNQIGGDMSAGLQALMDEREGLMNQTPGLGQQGLDQAGFLTDSQAQYDWLQNNELFQGALSNANDATMGMAAARGRVSAGDTLQQLSQNTLLAAAPLIAGQKGSIMDLIGFGERAAGNQANMLTGQGAALAGGIVGAENARAAGYSNLLNLAGTIGGAALAAGGTPGSSMTGTQLAPGQ